MLWQTTARKKVITKNLLELSRSSPGAGNEMEEDTFERRDFLTRNLYKKI